MKQLSAAIVVFTLFYTVWSLLGDKERVQVRTVLQKHGYVALLLVLAFVALFALFLVVVKNNGINLY